MTVKQNRDAGITPIEMSSTKAILINNEEIERVASQILINHNSENKLKNGKPIEKVRPMPKTTTNIPTMRSVELTNKIEKRKPNHTIGINNTEEERGRRRRKIETTTTKTTNNQTTKTTRLAKT